jgi:hypothetical protein
MKREKDNMMVSTAIRIPKKLRDRLAKVGGEGGMSDEIRRRLEASFAAEQYTSPEMRELLHVLSSSAREVAACCGDPATDPFAAAVWKLSAGQLMDHYRPKGEAVPHLTDIGGSMFGPDASVEEVGRYMARSQISLRAGTIEW